MTLAFFAAFFAFAHLPQSSFGFLPRLRDQGRRQTRLAAEKVGVFFGSASGSTEEVADLISAAFGELAAEPENIDDIMGTLESKFSEYDALVVGTPTYNTDADTQRSATSWDAVYYDELQKIALDGKHVAVFGLGDQEGYESNFADAAGELHDVFEAKGAKMHGFTSALGDYEHEESKAQRGDFFIGLICDNANQPDLTEDRVQTWVEQLKAEGFLGAASDTASSNLDSQLSSLIESVEESAESVASALSAEISNEKNEEYADFEPYSSPLIGQTLWLSKSDHRQSFYTFPKKANKS